MVSIKLLFSRSQKISSCILIYIKGGHFLWIVNLCVFLARIAHGCVVSVLFLYLGILWNIYIFVCTCWSSFGLSVSGSFPPPPYPISSDSSSIPYPVPSPNHISLLPPLCICFILLETITLQFHASLPWPSFGLYNSHQPQPQTRYMTFRNQRNERNLVCTRSFKTYAHFLLHPVSLDEITRSNRHRPCILLSVNLESKPPPCISLS